jgi:hypothetical protein
VSFGPNLAAGLVAGDSIAPFRFVSLDGSGRVCQSSGSSFEMAIGVSEANASVGQGVPVTFVGVAKVETATVILAGAPISSDGTGRAMSWVDSLSPVLAVALNESGGAGQFIRALITVRPTPVVDGLVVAVSPDRFPVPG